MLKIKDMLVCEDAICEAFIEPHMSELAKQLKEKNIKLSTILWTVTNALDEIDRSCVTVYKNINKKVLNEIRNYGKNYNVLIIGLIDGVVKIARNGEAITRLIPDNPLKGSGDYYYDFTNDLKNYYDPFKNRHGKTEYLDAFEHCDEVWIIDMSDLDVHEKKELRKETYKGVVLNTPEYYKQLAKENIERYKKIILSNRDKQVDEWVKEINDKIQDLFKQYTDIITDFTINPQNYNDYPLRLDIQNCGEAMKKVISSLQLYSRHKRELSEYLAKERISTSDYGSSNYYQGNVRKAKNELLNSIESMRTYIEIIKEKADAIKQQK